MAKQDVRLGIVGVGGMGSNHADHVLAGKVARLRLAAVCDLDARKLTRYPGSVLTFTDSATLIRSGAVDAVLVATPHYAHTTVGIDVLEAGLHLLVEKPISVHKADGERLIAAHRRPEQLFAAMFNQRTDPVYRQARALVQGGELGRLTRVNWIITNWFRTQSYYNSGGWRATWRGEGGGVLLNQCPHNLDLLQWIVGMPSAVRAFCHFGKWHAIEVEDEVTAYLEFAGGASGVFVTSTGEAPGTNRLEICGDRGRLIVENGQLRFARNETPMLEFLAHSPLAFAAPAVWNVEVPPAPGGGGQHLEILQNFAAAILDGTPLIAPAAEGLRSIELANAMLLSSLTGETLALPLDGARYEARLQELIRASRFVKSAADDGRVADLSASFSHTTRPT